MKLCQLVLAKIAFKDSFNEKTYFYMKTRDI